MKNKMYLLDCGSMWLDESLLVANTRLATLKNQHPEAHWTEIPCAVFVIDTPVGKIMFDAACDDIYQSSLPPEADRVSPYVFSPEQILPARLREIGLDFDDMRYVVLSHLHCDHIGYLYRCQKSEILASEAEFIHGMKHYGLKQPYGAFQFHDFDNFLAARLNWRLLPVEEESLLLAPGVTVVNLGPGHSYGMLGLLVELEHSGNFFLVSDALYTKANLGPPPRVPGIVHDTVGYRKTAEFIARFAKAHRAEIVYGHNLEQFHAMKKSAEGFYD